jgi:hypothetical protein
MKAKIKPEGLVKQALHGQYSETSNNIETDLRHRHITRCNMLSNR